MTTLILIPFKTMLGSEPLVLDLLSPLPLLPAPPLSPPHPTPACRPLSHNRLYQVVLVVKNPPASAGDKEIWVRSLGREYPLREGMSTHSSILPWRIPWTEEPGGL